MVIQLKVCGPRGEEKIIDLCDTDMKMEEIKVGYLQKKITKELRINCDFRMIFGTEPLEESSLLRKYGIKHMSTIHTVLMLPGGDRCGQEAEEIPPESKLLPRN